MNGPYQSEREARTDALRLAGPPRDGWSILSATQNRELLTRACLNAGVSLGAYDERILGWLVGWEDAICAVVAGLVTRAHAAGAGQCGEDDQAVILAALEEAASLIRRQAAICLVCETHPASLCSEHAEALRRAEAYQALAARMTGVTR